MGTADIANSPVLLAEVRRHLPSLQAIAKWPAGTAGVMRVIGSRFGLFPQPERSEEEWESWWGDYRDALQDIPLPALEAAMVEWVRKPDAQFLPKPGELRYMALQTQTREALAYQRARQAVDTEQPFVGERMHIQAPPKREVPQPTAADKARVKAWAAEFIAAQDAKTPPPTMRPNYGPIDETGITPELRALVERQRTA